MRCRVGIVVLVGTNTALLSLVFLWGLGTDIKLVRGIALFGRLLQSAAKLMLLGAAVAVLYISIQVRVMSSTLNLANVKLNN